MKLRPERVLIVEDQPRVNARAIKRLEVFLGGEVHKALGPKQARRILERENIRLVILDVIMPPGDLGHARTNGGVKTGFVFYDKWLRGRPLDVIVWTVSEEAVPDGDDVYWDWPDSVVLRSKKPSNPNDLVDIISDKYTGPTL